MLKLQNLNIRSTLENNKKTFVKGVIRQLKDILTVQNLGIFTSQIKDPNPDPDKISIGAE